ncbi:MAG: indole-3-glycerol phosphate synthase TrpC [Firmicutes bacterium]|nr:indole-3-glycerol phosphate synthase TrpC [Bacillota bacterium]
MSAQVSIQSKVGRSLLDDIIKQKRVRLKEEMEKVSIEGWKQRLKMPGIHNTLDFYKGIKKDGKISIIGEIKKASPSKGIIRHDFDPVSIAKEYLSANIEAISVLTESDYFLGSDDHMVKVRQFCPMPILRKDFIIDIWQIYQSRCLGADAILLITSVLSDDQLKKFQIVAEILGLQCLVEVHNEEDLERALDSGARIIGINNRDLKTFQVDLKTTERLISQIPYDRAVVSESGIKTHKDLNYLKELGVDAVLIGESLMRAPCIKEKVDELRGLNKNRPEGL